MSEYLSVAQLQDINVVNERIDRGEPSLLWRLHMPEHLDLERMQVNVSRLGVLHRVGAFTTSILSEYQGDTSESFNVASINNDGSAVAGKAVSKHAESSFGSLIDNPFTIMSTLSGKPIVVHNINRPEAVQNVISLKEDGKKDEQAWANVLDSAIRESFRSAGKEHLVKRAGPFMRLLTYGLVAQTMLGVAVTAETGSMDIAVPLYAAFQAFNITATSLANKLLLGDANMKDYRWSFFLDNQPDRYMVLNGISRIPGLVKSL